MAKTINGIDLNTFKGISDAFFNIQFVEEGRNTPPYAQDVYDMTMKVKDAIAMHMEGQSEQALATFREALKIRSSLLTDPNVNRSDEIHRYVKGVIAYAENGDPAESLELTKDLYANALDPLYKGEPDQMTQVPPQNDPPIL